LCDYLELNNNYRLILYRLKNASISGKIEATKKYSNLLRDLFTDGCFDSNASIKTLLQSRITYYRNNHALDELGIDNVNPLNGLTALIELIQQEVILIELETIEKLINE
jgi:Cu2+-containing amine oxidase